MCWGQTFFFFGVGQKNSHCCGLGQLTSPAPRLISSSLSQPVRGRLHSGKQGPLGLKEPIVAEQRVGPSSSRSSIKARLLQLLLLLLHDTSPVFEAPPIPHRRQVNAASSESSVRIRFDCVYPEGPFNSSRSEQVDTEFHESFLHVAGREGESVGSLRGGGQRGH